MGPTFVLLFLISSGLPANGWSTPLSRFVEANYTLLQTDLSLQKEISTSITEAAIDQTDTREIGFISERDTSLVVRQFTLLLSTSSMD